MKTVTAVRAVPHLAGERIDLSWQNPPASDFAGGPALAGIRIVRRERTFPMAPDDGDLVYDGALLSHFSDSRLSPLTTYYYAVFAVDSDGAYYANGQSHAAALATANYNLAERFFKLLPAVHQRFDSPPGPVELAQLDPAIVSALDALPAGLRQRGPLRRFFQAALAPLDAMRSLAETLFHLHHIDLARPEFLLLLARWLGWEADRTLPLFAQRNEVRFAPHLYRTVGTVPQLRTIVQRYTGWYAQVAEFAQHIARTNLPSQLNIFAIQENGGGWHGTDDAASLLGFGSGYRQAAGSGSLPATLTGNSAGPFALRPGMELAITADDRIPVAIRFQPGDFVDLGNATAAEVAAVLNRLLSEVTVTPLSGDRLQFRSHTVGPDSALRIEQHVASLVTLEGAPAGRLSSLADTSARLRLFYETTEPLAPLTAQAAALNLSGQSPPGGLLPGETPPPFLCAAPSLGFGAGNHQATGGEELPARLTSSLAEPYALQPRMGLTISLGSSSPQTVRFRAGEFDDLSRVTAGEVAAALTRQLSGLTATASAGRLILQTRAVGATAALRVEQYITAPPGGLAPEVARLPSRTVRYKTFRQGRWGQSLPLINDPTVAVGDPAVVELPDGRLWAAWIENPHTAAARLRFKLGAPHGPQPARLQGQRSGPFRIIPGSRLLFRGNWPEPEGFEFASTDFANPQHVTAAQLAGVLNSRLQRITASAAPDGTLRLDTAARGGDERLALDLTYATAARALGFDARNNTAVGVWGDDVTWWPSQNVTAAPAGRHADLHAVVDDTGAVRLFWATHQTARWRIVTTAWDQLAWVGTFGGLSLRQPDGSWRTDTTPEGLADNRVRAVTLAGDGSLWVGTAGGISLRRPDGSWASFTTADGLIDNSVRAVGVDPQGRVWVGTAGGVGVRQPDGSWSGFTTSDGLAHNSVWAVAVDQIGAAWFGTLNGASRRRPDGSWTSFTTADGLVDNDVQTIALAADGGVWFGTAGGASLRRPDGSWTSFTTADGLIDNDVRALALAADGAAWFGTAGGVSLRRPDGSWTSFTTADGLASNSVWAAAVDPDGEAWFGTSGGVSLLRTGGAWVTYTAADGLGSNAVRALLRPVEPVWSSRQELAAGGGGNREPSAALDSGSRLWLFWARRQDGGTAADSWSLRARVWNATGWSAELPITTQPVGGRTVDREPGVIRRPGGDLRLFFRSDRSGGPDLWSVTVSPAPSPAASAITPPQAVTAEAAANSAPTPIAGPDGTLWLLYRSDRSVPLSRVATRALPPVQQRVTDLVPAASQTVSGPTLSARLPDSGSLRRFAGTGSVLLADAARLRGSRRWDDLLAYTPQRPLGAAPPADDELYTRGTVGLYLSRVIPDSPLSQQKVERLRAVLARFLPINVRVVVILAPRLTIEYVYQAGADIGERYLDQHPVIEYYSDLDDSTAAALPDWVLLLATTAGHVSANPADLTTLRRRTYFPPPR